MSYIKLCYVYVNFMQTKVFHLQKLANQSMFEQRTCDRNGKQFIQWKQEKLSSFDIARNVLIERK